jgi:hypothetical protein
MKKAGKDGAAKKARRIKELEMRMREIEREEERIASLATDPRRRRQLETDRDAVSEDYHELTGKRWNYED